MTQNVACFQALRNSSKNARHSYVISKFDNILVTTAAYGPDAYEFAKDNPLTLLSGSNLLHLLAKHGHQARIDLKETKQILQHTNS